MHKQMSLRASRLCACGIVTLLIESAAAFPLKASGAGQRGSTRGSPTAVKKARRSVWDGVYTQAQADRGRQTYTRHCEMCHQSDLRGLDCAPSLVDEVFALEWNGRSVADFFEKVQTTMPSGAVGSLSAREYADIVSYVLSANKFPLGQAELPSESAKLTTIAIESNANR